MWNGYEIPNLGCIVFWENWLVNSWKWKKDEIDHGEQGLKDVCKDSVKNEFETLSFEPTKQLSAFWKIPEAINY